MPAEYTAIRDSCIKRKAEKQGHPCSQKQVKECKKLAAMTWIKRNGKPFPKDASGATSTDLLSFCIKREDFEDDTIFKRNFEGIQNDHIIGVDSSHVLNSEGDNWFVDIKLTKESDSFSFTQPFNKEEAKYVPSQLDIDGWHIDSCGACCHYLGGGAFITDWSRGFCHLVQGVINADYTCSMFSKSLIDTEIEEVDNNGSQENL